jgi:hypothetical protein
LAAGAIELEAIAVVEMGGRELSADTEEGGGALTTGGATNKV